MKPADTRVVYPERLADLPAEQVPALLVELAALQTALAARLAAAPGPVSESDRLVDVDEAAAMLGGVSRDFLYRSPAAKAFRVRVGGRVLFSRERLQAYIKRRAG